MDSAPCGELDIKCLQIIPLKRVHIWLLCVSPFLQLDILSVLNIWNDVLILLVCKSNRLYVALILSYHSAFNFLSGKRVVQYSVRLFLCNCELLQHCLYYILQSILASSISKEKPYSILGDGIDMADLLCASLSLNIDRFLLLGYNKIQQDTWNRITDFIFQLISSLKGT